MLLLHQPVSGLRWHGVLSPDPDAQRLRAGELDPGRLLHLDTLPLVSGLLFKVLLTGMAKKLRDKEVKEIFAAK